MMVGNGWANIWESAASLGQRVAGSSPVLLISSAGE